MTSESTIQIGRFELTAGVDSVFRVAALAFVASWFAGLYDMHILARASIDQTVLHPLFPTLLTDPQVDLFFYFLPAAALPIVLRWRTRAGRLTASAILVVASLGSLWHLSQHADAARTTAFWCSLWLLWLAMNSDRDDPGLMREASLLARTTVALAFLGGAVGKVTPGYWSGEVFYEFYFLRPELAFSTIAVDLFEPDTLRQLARWSSRLVVVSEFALAAIVVVPTRIAYQLFAVVVATMVLAINPQLLTAVGPLLGILYANRFWTKEG